MKATIELSDGIYEAATAAANQRDVTLSEYVEDAVRTALGRSDGRLPAYHCGGPAQVDLDDKEALGEILDELT